MFNSHMRCYVTQWSVTRLCGGVSVNCHPLPQEKLPLAAQLKSPFGDSYLIVIICGKVDLKINWSVNTPCVGTRECSLRVIGSWLW